MKRILLLCFLVAGAAMASIMKAAVDADERADEWLVKR